MARDRRSRRPEADKTEVLEQFQAAISGLGSGELQQVLRQLLAAGSNGLDPFERPPPPSQRRPPRSDVVTYQIRADLVDTKPPLWRRLELASDLRLDEVHDVLQVAFGWTDSHLHMFGSGGLHLYSAETETYLTRWELEDGGTGIPEDDVRLDEVLVDVGDKLFYAYDYGDGWEHVLKLEAVRPRDEEAPRAVCTAGRRPGPAEDCGGVHGYELICAASDPTHPNQAAAVAEHASFFGEEVDPAMHRPTPFDLAEINSLLAGLGSGEVAATADADLPSRLAELVAAVPSARGKTHLRGRISRALAGSPSAIDVETATRMVHPYAWLLHRVGVDGIKLTGAGYLPPIHVEAAATELGLSREWIGKNNRENLTAPVLHLRETAQKFGLLRKLRGQLVLTVRGRELRDDPVGLWWHLAERMPVPSTDPCERQAGLLFLIAVAGHAVEPVGQIPGQTVCFDEDDPHQVVATFLADIGWGDSDGFPMMPNMAAVASWDTKTVLYRLGGLNERARSFDPDVANADGATFARAALSRWPDSAAD